VGTSLPIPDCYWVDSGRLLAGEYPGAHEPAASAARLERFRAAGIGLFVDLTEASEIAPYAHLLDGVRHERRPIPDFGTTSVAAYRETLDTIDDALAEDVPVYVHCLGGLGRTGTVVGCWLVRHGLDDDNPVARIADLRRLVPGSSSPSPQTVEQRQVIEGWRLGD
jgi:protein-tyrosine phosphatase